jgi:hypothetical protein
LEGAEILSSDSKEGSEFQENDISVCSHDLDLSLKEYKSDAQEVSSREFDPTHTKKYVNPTPFWHTLWNAARPSAGAMVTCVDIIKDELERELAGVLAEFKNQPEQLISLLYKEAGMETSTAINFITAISAQLSQLCGEESKEENESHVKVITYKGEALVESTVDVATGRNHKAASKTQGTILSTQQASPTERTVIEPATEAKGDKEGVQSMSMLSSG